MCSMQGDSSSRSPAVFGAILSYIRGVLDNLGVELLDREVWDFTPTLNPPAFPIRAHSLQSTGVFSVLRWPQRPSASPLSPCAGGRWERWETPRGTLENVVEQLVRFRAEVRAFALSPDDLGPGGEPPRRPRPRPDREPLLKACDALRRDLAPLGVHLKVSSTPRPSGYRDSACALTPSPDGPELPKPMTPSPEGPELWAHDPFTRGSRTLSPWPLIIILFLNRWSHWDQVLLFKRDLLWQKYKRIKKVYKDASQTHISHNVKHRQKKSRQLFHLDKTLNPDLPNSMQALFKIMLLWNLVLTMQCLK